MDDGTMPIRLVAEALEGFSGSYRKTAIYLSGNEDIPELRVSAPKQGSFDLFVIAAMALTQDPAQLASTAAKIWDFAEHIFHIVSGVMNLKKHVKAQPYTISVKGDNNQVAVINAEKVELLIPPQALEVFQSKLIDRELDRIVDPLRPNRIDKAELSVEDKVTTVVTSDERKYFLPDASDTTTKSDELVGFLISLNKEHKRGTFKMQGGKTVPYHFVGEDDDQFRLDFSYKGPVRVKGVVDYDAEGNPIHVAVAEVERLQGELPFPEPTSDHA